MNLYAVIYLKGQLAAAMFLWPGATVRDCEKLNAEYAAILPSTSGIRYGEVKLHETRIRLLQSRCEVFDAVGGINAIVPKWREYIAQFCRKFTRVPTPRPQRGFERGAHSVAVFASIPFSGREYVKRPLDHIIRDLHRLPPEPETAALARQADNLRNRLELDVRSGHASICAV